MKECKNKSMKQTTVEEVGNANKALKEIEGTTLNETKDTIETKGTMLNETKGTTLNETKGTMPHQSKGTTLNNVGGMMFNTTKDQIPEAIRERNPKNKSAATMEDQERMDKDAKIAKLEKELEMLRKKENAKNAMLAKENEKKIAMLAKEHETKIAMLAKENEKKNAMLAKEHEKKIAMLEKERKKENAKNEKKIAMLEEEIESVSLSSLFKDQKRVRVPDVQMSQDLKASKGKGHKPADIKKNDDYSKMLGTINNIVKNMEVNCTESNGKSVLSELALAKKDAYSASCPLNLMSKKIFCLNEAAVQINVKKILDDVIKSLLLKGVVSVTEMSMFSMRPDLVVLQYCGCVVLTIEVKVSDPDMFESEQIAGQLYDYLQGMAHQGHQAPIAILTSYEQSCIALFDNKLVEYKQHVNTAKEILLASLPDRVTAYKRLEIEVAPESKHDVSPPSKYSSNHHVARNWCGVEDDNNNNEEPGNPTETPRSIVYSDVYGQDDTFQLFLVAVACAIAAYKRSDMKSTTSFLPEENEASITGKIYPMLCKNCLSWENITPKVKFTYKVAPGEKSKYFFFLNELGIGSSGKVFLVCNPTGKIATLKLYLSTKTFSHQEKNEECKTKAEEEEKRWKELNAEKGGEFVRCFQWNGFWWLLMPFVSPLPVNERDSMIDDVAKELERFADKSYMYKTDDIKWRHVGCYQKQDGNLEIVLIDLESLVLQKPQTSDIKRHVKLLKSRAAIKETILEAKTPSKKGGL